MAAYYNEIDLQAAQWLRNLIAAGHIAPGDVDNRSIVEVQADDLKQYTQCHFFAGIGVWSYALRLAGWSDDRPVWTGSCPCQPFSAAGKRGGVDDERHLWPEWFRLIRECRPDVVFGEQVSSKDALTWVDHVSVDMEAAGYAFGAVDTCAAGFGAPHIRQRLWFMARSLGDADEPGSQGRGVQPRERSSECTVRPPGPVNGFWEHADWIPCTDGKARPVEPGTFPLAHGATARVVRLRAYGNAINAQQAKEFIQASMSAL